MEFKRIQLENVQIKMDGDGYTFEGYASKFGGVDSYGDTVVAGAYAETLKNRERPIRMRWNHYGPVIGKWVELKEDDTGLFVSGSLTQGHSVAENVYASLKHGAVDGMSIGYRVNAFEQDGDRRFLKEIELVEISVVEEPADLGAAVGDVKHINGMIDGCESLKEFESLLREAAGFSKANATAYVSQLKKFVLGDQDPASVDVVELINNLKSLNR